VNGLAVEAMRAEVRVALARRAALCRLAEQTDPQHPDEHLVTAAAYADPSLTPDRLAVRWADLVAAVHLRERLNAGVVDWSAVDPELLGPGRHEAAERIAEDQVDEALDQLVGDYQ